MDQLDTQPLAQEVAPSSQLQGAELLTDTLERLQHALDAGAIAGIWESSHREFPKRIPLNAALRLGSHAYTSNTFGPNTS